MLFIPYYKNYTRTFNFFKLLVRCNLKKKLASRKSYKTAKFDPPTGVALSRPTIIINVHDLHEKNATNNLLEQIRRSTYSVLRFSSSA
jgi:hypothetical protein